MPNSRSVYNFVKLEIGKALRDAGGAPGPGQQPLTLSLPHPVTITSVSAAPNWEAPYLAGRLGAGAVLSRVGGESECGRSPLQQPERATATSTAASERHRAPRGPRPSSLRGPIVLSRSYGGNVRSLPPFSHGAGNLEALISLRCKEFRKMRGEKAKRPPSPESPKQMAISSTVAPSEHDGSP